ncbi:MAG: putative Holliday junction resolvase-like endonuclease [Gammaproteobacteria bacterium]|jgi:predicted Holliday junction resolvase-like endonuclease
MKTAILVMKIFILSLRSVLAVTFLVFAALSVGTAAAQQKEMSVEELELYIQEQKAALEQAISNRDETSAKAHKVQEALAKQNARREQLEKEVDELCLELDVADPGSYDDCKAQFSS